MKWIAIIIIVIAALALLGTCGSAKSDGANCYYTNGRSACIQGCMDKYKDDPEKASQCMAGVREEADRNKK